MAAMSFSVLTVVGLLACHFTTQAPPSCNSIEGEIQALNNEIDTEKILGHWVHSHEEDEGSRLVYRASSYKFPPSRGRDAFTLERCGVARIDHPGPVDRGDFATGRWVLDGNALSIDAGDWSLKLRIESWDRATLIAQRQ